MPHKKYLLFFLLSVSWLPYGQAMETAPSPKLAMSTPLALHKAARAGNVEAVCAFITSKANLEQLDSDKDTPLVCAVKGAGDARYTHGDITPHIQTIRELVQAGVNFLEPTHCELYADYPVQPLYYATGLNLPEVIHLFIDTIKHKKSSPEEANAAVKACVNMVPRGDSCKYSPLHVASGKGFVACMQELLSAGADLEARMDDGATPLSWAVALDKPEAVACLLEHNADIYTKKDKQHLVDKSDPDLYTYHACSLDSECTPLHFVQSLACAQLLVEKARSLGGDQAVQKLVNMQNEVGDTPLKTINERIAWITEHLEHPEKYRYHESEKQMEKNKKDLTKELEQRRAIVAYLLANGAHE